MHQDRWLGACRIHLWPERQHLLGLGQRQLDNRTTNNSTWRSRGYITADARNQTEYGTVRGYLAVGLSTNNTGFDGADNTFSANRAFIQWAGFTFGLSQSFYDFYSSPATSYWGSLHAGFRPA